jgi:hypothetical protein
MKRYLILSLFLLSLISLPSITFGQNWYEGGTLHNASAGDWHNASYQNRLATAADFIAKSVSTNNMSDLKSKATELEICITEATNDPRLYNMRVAEVGALCMVQLGLKGGR